MTLSRGSRWFLAFGLLGLAGVAAALWWLDTSFFVSPEAGVPVEYTVERGQSVRSVGDELQELGVVRSSFRFRTTAEDADLPARLQPGTFELETGMEIDDVIAVLAAGPLSPPTIRFTVPEGLTIAQTLERLAAQFPSHDEQAFRDVLDARLAAGENGPGVLRLPPWWPDVQELDEIVREPFEGLLWPQTYDIEDVAPPLQIMQRMVQQLELEVAAVPQEDVAATEALGIGTYETLVMASLIERETRVNDERPTVAGVIANRLAEGMRLQIDATVVYALGGEVDQIVRLEDLEVDLPHNTYRRDGLPPTPISGVGTASLRAAYAPADVTYRFYVLDPACDGRHRFADTGAEHEANVAAFREAGRCLEPEDTGADG